MEEKLQPEETTTEEIKYLESIEQRLNSNIEPFIRLSANLYVGYNGECDTQVAEKVERWMRETLFRAAMLEDVLKGVILVGWDESRNDVVIAVPPEGYKEAFEEVRSKVQTYADQLTSASPPAD